MLNDLFPTHSISKGQETGNKSPSPGQQIALIIVVSLIVGGLAGYATSFLRPNEETGLTDLQIELDTVNKLLVEMGDTLIEIDGKNVDGSELYADDLLHDATEMNQIRNVFDVYADSIVSIKLIKNIGGAEKVVYGTGFFIDEAGHIATNYHVIENYDPKYGIEVEMPMSHHAVEGTMISYDDYCDLAILYVDMSDMAHIPLTIRDSDSVKVGDPVVVIGNPFGYSNSMNIGSVSQTDRGLITEDDHIISDIIQFDAAVNSGNSGGPLMNLDGEVIGVVTNTISKVYGEGISFAIPSNLLQRYVDYYFEYGRACIHVDLGIHGRNNNLFISRAMNIDITNGVVVESVYEGSAAEAGGLRGGSGVFYFGDELIHIGGDVITRIDGVPVRTVEELFSYVESKEVGDVVRLVVIRDNEDFEIPLTLKEMIHEEH